MSSGTKTSNVSYKKMKLLANRLGFSQDNFHLLKQALTHSTYFEGSIRSTKKGSTANDNQRLEFLGDAVLDLVVGEYLFNHYPNAREGELSKMRAYLVCEASLAVAAEELDLAATLLMGKGAEAGGDRYRPSVLSDAYEAMIGAVFLAEGYQKAAELILRQFSSKMDTLAADDYEDKKSLLQELIQSQSKLLVSYKVLNQSGPDHQPLFSTGVYAGKILLGTGEGGSKKESEISAAEDALKQKDQWRKKI